MKILIVDRDVSNAELLTARLDGKGHRVVQEVAKNTAVDRIASEGFDLIFLDPAPLTSPRPLVLNIRRGMRSYPYIVMMSGSTSTEEALKAGTNDLLSKPIDPQKLESILVNAYNLTELVRRIGDDSEDFPSAGGVIAKSAFNQLFLSAIDRADRYGERTYVLFISLSNYGEILQLDGHYMAEYAVAKLSQYLVRLRRQSDIIGQTAKNEYALLLQRPLYETEPVEAANRFAEALSKFDASLPDGKRSIEITISLIEIPVGATVTEHVITLEGSKAASRA